MEITAIYFGCVALGATALILIGRILTKREKQALANRLHQEVEGEHTN
jgi:hypothetical protein